MRRLEVRAHHEAFGPTRIIQKSKLVGDRRVSQALESPIVLTACRFIVAEPGLLKVVATSAT